MYTFENCFKSRTVKAGMNYFTINTKRAVDAPVSYLEGVKWGMHEMTSAHC